MKTKRWSISLDGGAVWTEFSPANAASLTLAYERDLDAGEIFFRKKLGGACLLDRKGGGFQLVDPLNAEGTRCDPLLMMYEKYCDLEWVEQWRGEFAAGSGVVDLEKCLQEVSPEVQDRYSCIMAQRDVKRNILEIDGVVTSMTGSTIEYAGSLPPYSPPAGTGWTTIDDFPWDDDFIIRVYARRRSRTICVSGSPVPPPGGGWTLLSDDCATDGTATYVKGLTVLEANTIALLTASPWFAQGTCDGSEAIPPTPPAGATLVLVFDCSDPDYPSLWLILFGLGVLYPEVELYPETVLGRRSIDVIEYLVSECEDIVGVRSDFFGWNPDGTAPGYVPGENYVTGDPTQTENLIFIQKSDAINPTASNPATIGELTFSEFVAMLNTMFQVFWWIEDDGYLRIEHWKYFIAQQGLDITAMNRVVERLLYTFNTDGVPNVERLTFMESNGTDFVGLDLIYSPPCAKASADAKEYAAGRVTTDVTFIVDSPSSINRDGFLMLATTFDNSTYQAVIDLGAITGLPSLNAPLSTANLMRDYWTWNRYLRQATMNGSPVTFDGIRPNVKQGDVSIFLCCENFDPSEYLTTNLGERLGLNAGIIDASHNLTNDRLTMNLDYTL